MPGIRLGHDDRGRGEPPIDHVERLSDGEGVRDDARMRRESHEGQRADPRDEHGVGAGPRRVEPGLGRSVMHRRAVDGVVIGAVATARAHARDLIDPRR
ncbi:hypothetical protein [Microbacterium sp.]|uniref:hypothetical protein n=1 Tax=Microbacterium sp. TaxID=51671 RepID=UPI003A8A0509